MANTKNAAANPKQQSPLPLNLDKTKTAQTKENGNRKMEKQTLKIGCWKIIRGLVRRDIELNHFQAELVSF